MPGFAETYLTDGVVPATGDVLVQSSLGETLSRLAQAGLDDFYRGDVARSNATALQRVGSPLRLTDLETYQAQVVEPLSVQVSTGKLYNMTPPTQGISSLMILALLID